MTTTDEALVERVARAIHDTLCDGLGIENDGSWIDYQPEARAAIAAMQPAQIGEPVAWMYEQDGCYTQFRQYRLTNSYGANWTETPLYAHPGVHSDG